MPWLGKMEPVNRPWSKLFRERNGPIADELYLMALSLRNIRLRARDLRGLSASATGADAFGGREHSARTTAGSLQIPDRSIRNLSYRWRTPESPARPR